MAVDRRKLDEAKRKREARAKGEVEYPPEFDTSKKGTVISGKITRRESVPTPKGKQAEGRILELETEKGNFSIWEKTVLTSNLDRIDAQVGDHVSIECLGKAKGKNYYDFIVEKA